MTISTSVPLDISEWSDEDLPHTFDLRVETVGL